MHKQDCLGGLVPMKIPIDASWDSGLCCLIRGPLGGVTDRFAVLSARRSC